MRTIVWLIVLTGRREKMMARTTALVFMIDLLSKAIERSRRKELKEICKDALRKSTRELRLGGNRR
jgi:hypothetical protein